MMRVAADAALGFDQDSTSAWLTPGWSRGSSRNQRYQAADQIMPTKPQTTKTPRQAAG